MELTYSIDHDDGWREKKIKNILCKSFVNSNEHVMGNMLHKLCTKDDNDSSYIYRHWQNMSK